LSASGRQCPACDVGRGAAAIETELGAVQQPVVCRYPDSSAIDHGRRRRCPCRPPARCRRSRRRPSSLVGVVRIGCRAASRPRRFEPSAVAVGAAAARRTRRRACWSCSRGPLWVGAVRAAQTGRALLRAARDRRNAAWARLQSVSLSQASTFTTVGGLPRTRRRCRPVTVLSGGARPAGPGR